MNNFADNSGIGAGWDMGLGGGRCRDLKTVQEAGNLKITVGGDRKRQMTVEAATPVGVDGHGIGVQFTLKV